MIPLPPAERPEIRILNVRHESRDPATLKLAERNPRRGEVERLKEAFQENGFHGTVLHDELTGQVLAGNHRVKAAAELGMPEIPVTVIRCESEAHAKRILIADNRLSDLAGYDEVQLAQLLGEIQAEGGLAGTGYTTQEYQDLLDSLGDQAFQEGLTDPDEAPELPLEGREVSRDGDIWQIGPHRVGCGSSTDPAHVARLVAGAKIRLVWTDPPYNVDYEGKTKDRLKIANDAMSPAQFREFLEALFTTTVNVMQPGACIYVAYAEVEAESFHGRLRAAGVKYAQTIIWVKNAGVLSRQDFNWQHEPILYGWRTGAGHYFNQDFTQTTVIDDTPDPATLSKAELVQLLRQYQAERMTTVIYEDKPARNGLHPTMKPVNLVRRLMIASSRTGDAVYDPCAGSGTTGVAAHQANREAILNDLDPGYVDVIVERLQAFSGLTATRQDGATYDELKAQRSA